MNLEVTGISNALRLRAVGETVACPQASTCETVGIPSTPKPSPNQVLLTSHAPCTPPVLAHPFWRAVGAGEGWSRMQSIAATPAPSTLAPHLRYTLLPVTNRNLRRTSKPTTYKGTETEPQDSTPQHPTPTCWLRSSSWSQLPGSASSPRDISRTGTPSSSWKGPLSLNSPPSGHDLPPCN